MEKLALFIGSSVEGLPVAKAIQKELFHTMEVTIWNQMFFTPSGNTLHELIAQAEGADFALFVFTPDDVLKMRNQTYSAARDNVILEFGLFIGKIGLNRTYYLIPQHAQNLHLPTDLQGINPLKYDDQHQNLQAGVGPAAWDLQRMAEKLKKRNV